MRAEIAVAITAGRTEQQIVEGYVGQYGERILLEPRGNRSWWLILTPIAALVAGAAILAQVVKRKAADATPAHVHPSSVEVNDADLEW
jgi:cytochrome c-type biogenesis protein CcmH/NrfF